MESTMNTKEKTSQGKTGMPGTYKAGGFTPAKPPKKAITLLDILLGRK
jgi:hypothetical protein